MHTDMQSNNLDTPTEELFEAYHGTIAARDRAARLLFTRAVSDITEAIWQGLHHFDPEVIRKAATYGHCEVDAIWKLMSEVIATSQWSFITYKCKAVLDGAEACGISPWCCYSSDYGSEAADNAGEDELAAHVLQVTVRDRLQTHVEAMARHMGVWEK